MLTLYHGSLVQVPQPLILAPTRTLDYGAGFYTTTSRDQAERWVHRKLSAECPSGFVNVYEADIEAIRRELNVLWFEQTNGEWLDFVMANRTNPHYRHNYDAVYGPVANDKVYTAFALFESGVLNREELIRELRAYTLVDQLLFHTDRSLTFLRFIQATPALQ